MLPAFALAAMMSVAQAQTATDQDHDAHHPDGSRDDGAGPARPGADPVAADAGCNRGGLARDIQLA